MKKRWLLVLFLVGAAILTAGTLNRASAEVQWQDWGKDLYRTETEHFVFMVHVGPGKKENDKRAIETAERAEEFYNATAKFVQGDYDGKIGIFLELAGRDGYYGEKQIMELFTDMPWVGAYPFGSLERSVSVLITRICLRMKLQAIPPEWLECGLAEYIYWREVEKKPWSEIRAMVDKMDISVGSLYINPMANPTSWSRNPGTYADAYTALVGVEPYRASIFYYLDERFGAGKIKDFLDQCEGNLRYDSALGTIFAPKKELEAGWRLFVMFDGISKLTWQESKGDFRTQQPGVEIRLKKNSALWYNQKADGVVSRLARSVAATDEVLGLTPSDPRKIPVVTIEFNSKNTGTTLKQSGTGCLIRTKNTDMLETGTEQFAEEYAGKALQQAKLQKLPSWAGAGLSEFLSERVSGKNFAQYRGNVDGWEAKGLNSMNTSDDLAALASFLWFMDDRYGHKAVVTLLTSLNGGTALEQAATAATGREPAALYGEWLRAVLLPAKPALSWKETEDGLEAETPGLKVLLPVTGQLLTVNEDGEQALARASKTAQALERLTGYKPGSPVQVRVEEGQIEVGAGQPDSATVTAGYLDDNSLTHALVGFWLVRTSAGKPENIPAWVGEGLTWYVLQEDQQADTDFRSSQGEISLDRDAWCTPWDYTASYDSSDSEAWGTAVKLLFARYGSKTQSFLGQVARKGADTALKEALGKNFASLANEWLTYAQIQSVSYLNWTQETRDETNVVFKTIIKNVTVRVVMPAQSLVYSPDHDEILGQVGKWAESESGALGLSAVPAISVKLFLADDGSRLAFSHDNLTISVSDNQSTIWTLDQAIAFEMARALIEQRWKVAEGRGSVPAWLSDGLAAYLAYQQTDISLLRTPDPLTGLKAAIDSYSPESITSEEPFALACVFRFLSEKHAGSPGRIVDSLARGSSIADALRTSTGKDTSALETEFSEAVTGW